MSLSASGLGSLIDSALSGKGANGSNRTKFCNALAAGIVMSIKGKSFKTIDLGAVPGAGVGTGIGITGLQPSSMAQKALAAMSSRGENAPKLMDAIMSAVVQHMSQASLKSIDSPCYTGTGKILVGSIMVTEAEMAQNIRSSLSGAGANGDNCMPLSKAIAAGVVFGIMSQGTGTLVIAGSPSVPHPVAGGGAGSGVIS